MMHESLPAWLRVLRAREGLHLTEAAKKIGIGRDTLSDLERGARRPAYPTLRKIAAGYGVPVEELLEEPVLAGSSRSSSPAWPFYASEEEFSRWLKDAPRMDLHVFFAKTAEEMATSTDDHEIRARVPGRATAALEEYLRRFGGIGRVIRHEDGGEEQPGQASEAETA
jgi:transcriptional regulator with XRE-family HTH domain